MKKVIHEEGSRPIKLWTEQIEESALQQLKNIAQLPFIYKHVAAMPDVHFGIGATVGSVIATKDAIIPAAVGVDIGCGMMAVQTSLAAEDLPDSLAEIRHSIERGVPNGFGQHNSPQKQDENERLLYNADLRNWTDWEIIKPASKNGVEKSMCQLGTLGGGNHFIEICLDGANAVWVMLHSGSRGIGNQIGTYFIEKAREDMRTHFINLPDRDLAYFPEGTEHFDAYWKAVAWAQRYAALNREVMMAEVLRNMRHHISKPFEITDHAINCHHNYVAIENHFGGNCYVTRKGAIRAREGDLGIIPGSMGQRSYIVKGLGNPESFNSCSHGAGRVMGRKEARRRFTVADLERQTAGVECRKDDAVLDEIPSSYKNIDEVMERQKDLVEPLFTLKQVLCVKGG